MRPPDTATRERLPVFLPKEAAMRPYSETLRLRLPAHERAKLQELAE